MNILLAGILGLAAGYLVDYLSIELRTGKKWGQPVCTYCGAKRDWVDYVLLSACSSCHKSRPWRSMILLAIGASLSVFLWVHPPLSLGFWLSLLVTTYLGLVFIIDVEHHEILFSVSIFGALFALAAGTYTHGFTRTLLGGLAGYALMWIFYQLGVKFARYRARRQALETDEPVEALGYGDVTISGVLGLFMGFGYVFQGLFTGIVLAGVFSLLLIIGLWIAKKFTPGDIYIPYGPFLILGAGIYIFFY